MKKPNLDIFITAAGTGALLLLLSTATPTYAQQEEHKQDRPSGQEQQAEPPRQEKQQDKGRQEQQEQAKGQQEKQDQQQAKGRQEQQQQQAKGQQEKQQQQAKSQQEQRQQQAKGQQEKQQQQAKGRQEQQAQQQAKGRQEQQAQQQAKGQQKQQQQQAKGQQKQQQQQAKGQQKQQQQQAKQPSQPVQRVRQSEERSVWQQHRANSWQTEHRTWQQRGGYDGYRIPDYHFRGYFGRHHEFRIFSLSLEIFGGYPRFQYGGYWFSVLDPWPEYWTDDWYENDDVYIDYSGDGYYMYNRRYPRDRIAVSVFVN
jgi:hypothetical protein